MVSNIETNLKWIQVDPASQNLLLISGMCLQSFQCSAHFTLLWFDPSNYISQSINYKACHCAIFAACCWADSEFILCHRGFALPYVSKMEHEINVEFVLPQGGFRLMSSDIRYETEA